MAASGNVIHTSINNGHFQQIRFHIDRGAEVNEQDRQGRTPLILCALVTDRKWSVGLARLLLENGARISLCDHDGFNALHHACINQNKELVDVYLAALDCDVNSKCKQGNTSLHFAASLGDREIIEALANLVLKYKLSFDPKNKKGLTPLHQAFKGNHLEIGDLLIDFGADETVISDIERKSGSQLRQEAVERLDLLAALTSSRSSSRLVKQIKSDAEKTTPARPSTVGISAARKFDLRNNPEYVFHTTAVNYFQGKNSRSVHVRPKTAIDEKSEEKAWHEELLRLWAHYEARYSASLRKPAQVPAISEPTKGRSDSVFSSGGGLSSFPSSRRSSRISVKSRAGSISMEGNASRRSSTTRRSNGTLPLVRAQTRTSITLTGQT